MSGWRFLLDENVDPKTATYLETEGVDVEHVRDVLGQGADDQDDVLPYAREHDRIIVTSDLGDFRDMDPATHAGVVILFDDTMSAHRIASALLKMVETYPNRAAFPGRERLDSWT